MKSLKNINKNKIEYNQILAQILGYCGLIPFLISNILVYFYPDKYDVSEIITIYSYIIISFLGGIYWGVGLKNNLNTIKYYFVSTLPAILIFINLLFITNQLFKFIYIIIILNLFLLIEILFLKNIRLSRWFYLLRIRLNILLTLLLFILAINI